MDPVSTPSPELPVAPCLGHLSLPVRELDRSLRFYTTVLGLVLRWREGRLAVLVTARGDELALQATGAPVPVMPNVHFGFRVGSAGEIDQWHRHLTEQAVRGLDRHSEASGEQIYFEDPDGWRIEVYWSRS